MRPGIYHVPRLAGSVAVSVGEDGIVRFVLYRRQWAYRLVDAADGQKAEDAIKHDGTEQERATARGIALRALRLAHYSAA